METRETIQDTTTARGGSLLVLSGASQRRTWKGLQQAARQSRNRYVTAIEVVEEGLIGWFFRKPSGAYAIERAVRLERLADKLRTRGYRVSTFVKLATPGTSLSSVAPINDYGSVIFLDQRKRRPPKTARGHEPVLT